MPDHPTKEQWAAVIDQLGQQFTPVYLLCDGFYINAGLQRVSRFRLGIVVAINGWQYRGEWLKSSSADEEMAEEARRFYWPKKLKLCTGAQIKKAEKALGKKRVKALGWYDKQLIMPVPIWGSARSLIAHLKRHNQSIEIIDYETYRAGVDAVQGRYDA